MTDTEASQRRSVYIPDQIWRRLRLQAIENNTNVSELIREAIATMTPSEAGENAPEFAKRRSTGTHHHFNAVVGEPGPELNVPAKTLETSSEDPELDKALVGFKSALDKLMLSAKAPDWMLRLARSEMYKAWKAAQNAE